MDTSLSRKPSLLSDLRWDPVSGSCVLKSSLRVPDGDTNQNQDTPEPAPIHVPLQRRASAPLPSGAKTSNGAYSKPLVTLKKENGACMENRNDPTRPILNNLVTKQTQRASISTSFVEKAGTASLVQKSHHNNLKDISICKSQTSSPKSLFGVVLRPASFSGSSSVRPFRGKSVPGSSHTSTATKASLEMSVEQDNSMSNTVLRNIETSTHDHQWNIISDIDKRGNEKNIGVEHENRDLQISPSGGNQSASHHSQHQYYHITQELQHERKETQNKHAHSLKRAGISTNETKEHNQAGAPTNESSQRNEDKVSTNESNERNQDKVSTNESSERNEDKVSTNESSERNGDKVSTNESSERNQDKVSTNESNERNQDKVSTNESSERNEDKVSTNESNERNQDKVSTNESSERNGDKVSTNESSERNGDKVSTNESSERNGDKVSTNESSERNEDKVSTNESNERNGDKVSTNESSERNRDKVSTNESNERYRDKVSTNETNERNNQNDTLTNESREHNQAKILANGYNGKKELAKLANDNNGHKQTETSTNEINEQKQTKISTNGTNQHKPPGHLRRDVSLPYDQSVLKKRGSLPLKPGVPSFLQAKQMFTAGNNAESLTCHRKNSVSDTLTIKVNVRDLVRRLSDSSPGTDRRGLLTSGLANHRMNQPRDQVFIQHVQSESELSTRGQHHVVERSDSDRTCPKWRQGIELPITVTSNNKHPRSATECVLKASGIQDDRLCPQKVNSTDFSKSARSENTTDSGSFDAVKEYETKSSLGAPGDDEQPNTKEDVDGMTLEHSLVTENSSIYELEDLITDKENRSISKKVPLSQDDPIFDQAHARLEVKSEDGHNIEISQPSAKEEDIKPTTATITDIALKPTIPIKECPPAEANVGYKQTEPNREDTTTGETNDTTNRKPQNAQNDEHSVIESCHSIARQSKEITALEPNQEQTQKLTAEPKDATLTQNITTEPKDATQTQNITTEPKDATQTQNIPTEPKDATQTQNITTEPKDATQTQKLTTEPKDATQTQNITTEPKDATQTQNITTEPKDATQTQNITTEPKDATQTQNITTEPKDATLTQKLTTEPKDATQTTAALERQGKKSVVASLINKFSPGSVLPDAKHGLQATEKNKRQHNHHHRLSLPTPSLGPIERTPSHRSKVRLGRTNSLRGPVNDDGGQGHNLETVYMDQAEIERLLLKSQELRRSKQQLNRLTSQDTGQAASESTADMGDVALDSTMASRIRPDHEDHTKELSMEKPESQKSCAPMSNAAVERVVSYDNMASNPQLDQICQNATLSSTAQNQPTKVMPGGNLSTIEPADQNSSRVEELMNVYSKSHATRRTTITTVASSGVQETKARSTTVLSGDTKGDLLLAATHGSAAKPPPAPTVRKSKPHREAAPTKHTMASSPREKGRGSVVHYSNGNGQKEKHNISRDKGQRQHNHVNEYNTNGAKTDDQVGISVISEPDGRIDSTQNHIVSTNGKQDPEESSTAPSTPYKGQAKDKPKSTSSSTKSPRSPHEKEVADFNDDGDDNVFSDESFTSCVNVIKTSQVKKSLPLNQLDRDTGSTSNKSHEPANRSIGTDKPSGEISPGGLHFPCNSSQQPSQAERIARYKEDRRRQLAYVSEKVGLELTAAPGLNPSSTTSYGQRRNRSLSSSNSSTESKPHTRDAPSDSDRIFSRSANSTSVSSYRELDVGPENERSENQKVPRLDDNDYNTGDTKARNAHGSPRSKNSTQGKHDCVFKRLTASSKKPPRCRKNRCEEPFEEKEELAGKASARSSRFRVSSTDNSQVDTTDTPCFIRSSLTAAKRCEQPGQSVSTGLSPREVSAINRGIANFQSESRNHKTIPKCKATTPANSPRGNRETNLASPRYAFGSRIPSPNSSPREPKTSLLKNRSSESVVKRPKNSPRELVQVSVENSAVTSPRNLKPSKANPSPVSSGLSETGFERGPLHYQPSVPPNTPVVLMSPNYVVNKDKNDLPEADQTALTGRKSAPTPPSKSSSAETELEQCRAPSSETEEKKTPSHLSIAKAHIKTHTASVFSKDYTMGMKKIDIEKHQNPIKNGQDQMSFTRLHLSKSRLPPWGFGTRLHSGDDGSYRNAKSKNSSTDKDPHRPCENAEKKTEDTALNSEQEAPQTTELKKNSRVHDMRETFTVHQKVDTRDRRRSLPPWKSIARSAVDTVMMSRASGSLAKRASLGSEPRITSSVSRAERLQNLRREQNKTFSQFKQFMRREERSGEASEITQVTEEHVAHVQECCIRVGSVEEAENLAKALVESVRQGKPPELCLQQISSSLPGCIQSPLIPIEPGHQSTEMLTQSGKAKNPCKVTAKETFFDAVENSACPKVSNMPGGNISSCTKELKSCPEEVSKLASKALNKVSSSSKAGKPKFQSTMCALDKKIEFKVQEIGSSEREKTRTTLKDNSTEKTLSQCAPNLNNELGSTATKTKNSFGCSLKAHKDSSNEKPVGETRTTLHISSMKDNELKLAESLLDSSELSSAVREDNGYHVIQQMSPRPVMPVMIVPGQERTVTSGKFSSTNIPCIEVSTELKVTHHHLNTDIASQTKDQDHSSLKLAETTNAHREKIVSYLTQEYQKPSPVKTLHSFKENEPAPNSTEQTQVVPAVNDVSGNTEELLVRPKDSAPVSPSTETGSSTLTTSSQTTMYSGPYVTSNIEQSVTSKSSSVGGIQCDKKVTSTTLDGGDAHPQSDKRETQHSSDEDKNISQRWVTDAGPKVHGSPGLLNVLNIETENTDMIQGDVREHCGRLVCQHDIQPGTDDLGVSELQSSEYHTVPLDGDVSVLVFQNLKRPVNAKLDVETQKPKLLEGANGNVTDTSEDSAQVSHGTEAIPDKKTTGPRGHLESSLPNVLSTHNTIDSPKSKKAHLGGGQNLDEVHLNGVRSTHHRECPTELFPGSKLDGALYPAERTFSCKDPQTSEQCTRVLKDIPTKQVSSNPPTTSTVEDSKDKERDPKVNQPLLRLNDDSMYETLGLAEQTSACDTCVSEGNHSINDQPDNHKPSLPNELTSIRSSTFVKKQSDIGQWPSTDVHLESRNSRELPAEDQPTGSLRADKMNNEMQESFDFRVKHTASQTVCHTYKDAGTDSLHRSQKPKVRNVHPERETQTNSCSLSLHTHASVQSLETNVDKGGAGSKECVRDSCDEDQPRKIETKGTTVKASERTQVRGVTFVVQDHSKEANDTDSSVIYKSLNTETDTQAKRGSKISGDKHVVTKESNLRYRSQASGTHTSLNKAAGKASPTYLSKEETYKRRTSFVKEDATPATSKDPLSMECSPAIKCLHIDTINDKNVQRNSASRKESCQFSRKIPEDPQVSSQLRRSPKPGKSQLDRDYLINNLDLSSDSFDSLYLQNALYLKSAATSSATKVTSKLSSGSRPAPHNTPLTSRRRRSPSLHTLKGQTPRNRRRSLLVQSGAGWAACGVEELALSPGNAWRINKGRLPSPCVQKVKKTCRRLPRPPTQPASKRGGAKRQLPTPNGTHNLSREHCTPRTKRRVSQNKPRPQHGAASDIFSQQFHGICSQENGASLQHQFEVKPRVLRDENPRETSRQLSEDDGGERDLQGFLDVDSDSDMEARRRRRLLERVARVSSEEAGSIPPSAATSWRSKVYNDEVALRPEKDDNGLRRKSQDLSRRSSRDSCDLNNIQDSNGFSESRESDEAVSGDFLRRRSSRRMSEESNCSDQLSERLARRRAQRLEEAGDSSSLDSSFDSPRLQRDALKGQRRSSRDVVERLEDEGRHENDHQISGFGRVEASRYKGDEESNGSTRSHRVVAAQAVCAWGDPRQRSGDSIMSVDSVNDPDEGDEEDDGETEEIRSLRTRRRLRRRQSEESATGGSSREHRQAGGERGDDVGERRRRGRNASRWGGEDSSFQSTESNTSFRSCEEWSTSGHWTSKDSRTFSEEAPLGTSADLWSKVPDSGTISFNNNNNVNNNNQNNNSRSKNGTTLSDSSSCGDIYSLAPTSTQPEDNNNARLTGNSHTGGVTQSLSSVGANGQIQKISASNPNNNLDSTSATSNGNLDPHHQGQQWTNQNAAIDQHQDGVGNGENDNTGVFSSSSNTTTTSDRVSHSPTGNESTSGVKLRKKKTHKDKTALRKSPLNMAPHPSDEDTGHAGSSQDERRTRLRTEGSVVSQHASFWEHQAPLTTQHAPASRPTGFSDRILAKINATRQKFCQNEAAAATADAVASASDNNNIAGGNGNVSDGTGSGRKITARGRADFGQLLQKFSRSESSNSEERSDGEPAGKSTTSGVTRHRSFVRRQGAEEKASSSGSEVTDRLARRTPERAQSLRLAEKSAMFSSPTTSGKIESSAPLSSAATSNSATTTVSTAGKVESLTVRPRRPRAATAKETGSGNNSEDGGNSSSSSTSSRSGFRSEFMAKRLAGQTKVTETANTGASPSPSPSSQLKSVSVEQNGINNLASSSTATPDPEVNPDGSLTFISGRTGDKGIKQASNVTDKTAETGRDKVLILGGVTTTASSDSSLSLGILPGARESSTDDKSGPSVSEEKKSPRSAFLTRLNQSPEKTAVQPEREVGSLLRSLRSQRISSRSPSLENPGVQGSTALSQLSATAHDTKVATQPESALDTKLSTNAHGTKPTPSNGSTEPGTTIPSRSGERKTSVIELTPVTVTTTQKADKPQSKSEINAKQSITKPSSQSKLLNVNLSGSKSLDGETNSLSKHPEPAKPAVQASITTVSSSRQASKTPGSNEELSSTAQKPRANTISTISSNANSSGNSEESKETSSTNSSIKRSASMKEVPRKDSFETKRKGILKRTSSLSKPEVDQGSSFPVVDPQLAKILQQRKKIVGDVEEKVEEEDEEDEEENVGARRRRSRALSAAEEIEETLKYSQQLAAERGRDPEADEALKRRSVAERVYFMQTRIEEVEKSNTSTFTSRPRSGTATPRSRPISGIISPIQQASLDESLASSTNSSSHSQQLHQNPSTTSTTATTTTTTTNNNSATPSALVVPAQTSKTQTPSTTSVSVVSPEKKVDNKPQQNGSDSSDPPTSNSAQISSHSGPQNLGSASPPNKQSGSHTVLSGSQLMEKLTQLADATEVYQERRQKFTEQAGGAKDKGGAIEKGGASSSKGVVSVVTSASGKGGHRTGDQGRYQTQPITVEEIRAADSLETVSAFRALVRKKTAEGALEQLGLKKQHVGYSYTPVPATATATTTTIKQQTPLQQQQQTTATAVGKRAEFPQHLTPTARGQRRVQRLRRRTLPVTAEELNSVPENTALVTSGGCTKEGDTSPKPRDTASPCSRYDSGILSESSETVGSTGNLNSATSASAPSKPTGPEDELLDHVTGEDQALRDLVLEMDLGSNDPCRMSLSAKTSLFQGLEEKTKAERDKEKSASGARRYINRKKRERSQTMPITDDEMSSASQIGGNGSQSGGPTSASGARGSTGKLNVINLPKPEVVNRSRPSSMVEADEADQSDDELTKLSLSEKVKLFSQLKEKEKEKEKAPAKPSAPSNRRKNRKQASRFNTQPVTSEEVEKAAEFSRISPLAMSLVKPPDPEILKTLPFKDQRQMMAQHAEMCLSQASSRAQSRSGSMTSLNQSQPGSRRQSVTVEDDLASAVKEGEEKTKENRGILKVKSTSSVDVRSEMKSILKTEPSRDRPGLTTAASTHSILKHSTDDTRHSDSGDNEPRGILKRRASQDGGSASSPDVSRSDVKGILKRTGSKEDVEDTEGSPRVRSRSNSQPSSGILKEEGSSHVDSERKGILKGGVSSEDNSGLDSCSADIKAQTEPGDSSDISLTQSPRREHSSMSTSSESKADGSSSAPATALEELQLHLADRRARLEEQEAASAAASSSSSPSKPHTTIPTTKSETPSTSSATTSNSMPLNTSSDIQVSSVHASSSGSNTATKETLLAEPKEEASGLPSNSEDGEGESSAGELLDTDTPKRRLKRKSRFADRAARKER